MNNPGHRTVEGTERPRASEKMPVPLFGRRQSSCVRPRANAVRFLKGEVRQRHATKLPAIPKRRCRQSERDPSASRVSFRTRSNPAASPPGSEAIEPPGHGAFGLALAAAR